MNRFRHIRGTQIQGGSTSTPDETIDSGQGSQAYLGAKYPNRGYRKTYLRVNKNSQFVDTDGGLTSIFFYKNKLHGYESSNNKAYVFENGIWSPISFSDYKAAELASQLENFVPESPVKKIALIGGVAVAGLIFWKKVLPMIKGKK